MFGMRGLKWAAGVAGAAGFIACAAVAVPSGASAEGGDPLVMGVLNEAHGPTSLTNDSPYGPTLWVSKGFGTDSLDVLGPAGRPAATINSQANERALLTYTNSEQATVYSTNAGNGPAIYGTTTKDAATAILGLAGSKGRGARLRGGAAQLYLEPGTASTHPANGQVGDLYLDKSGRLWFCKGGSSWKQLA